MKDLNGAVAVITGGAGANSIGLATARLFAAQGAKIVIADVDAAAIDVAVAELTADGHDALGVPTDVADLASMRALADAAFDHFGKVDIAFLNAGISGGTTLFEDDLAAWDRVFGVNLFGILHGIKAFAPRMIAQGTPGHILGTSSGAGAVGTMYQTPGYSVSKAGVVSLMECLYGTLRDAGSQIRAHVVLPPLTQTNLAGNPDLMPMVQAGLEAGGAVAVLAQPDEVAVTVLEAIQTDSFWAHHGHEADARLAEGRYKGDIDWQDDIIRARAASIIDRTAPDAYIWGMKAPS